jgi:hypothetical protein
MGEPRKTQGGTEYAHVVIVEKFKASNHLGNLNVK